FHLYINGREVLWWSRPHKEPVSDVSCAAPGRWWRPATRTGSSCMSGRVCMPSSSAMHCWAAMHCTAPVPRNEPMFLRGGLPRRRHVPFPLPCWRDLFCELSC
ncbi:hypothetical protein GGP41_007552, partial [Bipolaris sorokiniana]